MHAFALAPPLPGARARGHPLLHPAQTATASRRPRVPRMQLPPPGAIPSPPLTEEQVGPPDYKWDPAYPGTLKPGSKEDNFPLDEVLASGVYERMQYQEYDTDACDPVIVEPDEDLLEWLAREGKLIPRNATEDEFDLEADRQATGITEEDLEYGEDDDKMLAYYSRQGEGSAAGASADFGGFAESYTDAGAGFGS